MVEREVEEAEVLEIRIEYERPQSYEILQHKGSHVGHTNV